MEFESIFASIAVSIVAIFAFLSFTAFYNNEYGTTAGSAFNGTLASMQALGNNTLISTGTSVGNNSLPSEGAGSTTSLAELASRALKIITTVPVLLGITPTLMSEAAIIIGVPQFYVDIAITVFIFTFAMIFGYLLLLGYRRLA